MTDEAASFLTLIKNPVKFRFFLFSKLPAAFFAGLRLKEANEAHATVIVPYSWRSKNPFGSTYFACLAMAAEMSTGILSMMHVYKRRPGVSMLVVKMESVFHKKATGITAFTCNDGLALKHTIEESVQTGEARTFTTTATGTNEANELIAEFYITWSFKARSSSRAGISGSVN